ncbi:hypothetical protein [Bradyrhizobium sp. 23AC]
MIWASPFDVAFAGAPILLVTWAAAALASIIMAFPSAQARLMRRTLSLSILPLVTIIMTANASLVWPLAMETGERLHFLLARQAYFEDVAKLPISAEPRFAMWRWGGFTIGHGVVYDESDEILLPEQSQSWKNRVAKTEIGMCGVSGTRLEKHFYLVRTGC